VKPKWSSGRKRGRRLVGERWLASGLWSIRATMGSLRRCRLGWGIVGGGCPREAFAMGKVDGDIASGHWLVVDGGNSGITEITIKT
jgi:hypothetical protein